MYLPPRVPKDQLSLQKHHLSYKWSIQRNGLRLSSRLSKNQQFLSNHSMPNQFILEWTGMHMQPRIYKNQSQLLPPMCSKCISQWNWIMCLSKWIREELSWAVCFQLQHHMWFKWSLWLCVRKMRMQSWNFVFQKPVSAEVCQLR